MTKVKHVADAEIGAGYPNSYIHTVCRMHIPANQTDRYTWNENEANCAPCKSPVFTFTPTEEKR